jgi:hypothetical protein
LLPKVHFNLSRDGARSANKVGGAGCVIVGSDQGSAMNGTQFPWAQL